MFNSDEGGLRTAGAFCKPGMVLMLQEQVMRYIREQMFLLFPEYLPPLPPKKSSLKAAACSLTPLLCIKSI